MDLVRAPIGLPPQVVQVFAMFQGEVWTFRESFRQHLPPLDKRFDGPFFRMSNPDMSTKPGLDPEVHRLARHAPSGYFVGLHIRFTSPLMTLQTYPPAWTDHYTRNGYALRDPIIAWGFSFEGARRWSEIDIPDPFNILGQAKEFGLAYGVSVSVGPLTSRTIGSVARSDREYTDSEIDEVSAIIRRLHGLSQPPDRLTQAQVEALRLIAEGDRHAAAAAKLNISESALKARLTAARDKLMARTTAEAIQRAKDYGLL